jgi:hypothetical protein
MLHSCVTNAPIHLLPRISKFASGFAHNSKHAMTVEESFKQKYTAKNAALKKSHNTSLD